MINISKFESNCIVTLKNSHFVGIRLGASDGSKLRSSLGSKLGVLLSTVSSFVVLFPGKLQFLFFRHLLVGGASRHFLVPLLFNLDHLHPTRFLHTDWALPLQALTVAASLPWFANGAAACEIKDAMRAAAARARLPGS